VSGQYAYYPAGDNGLEIIDVSDPANPLWVGSYASGLNASGVDVSGSYAYVTDPTAGLQVLDVSNPTQPELVGGYQMADASGVKLLGQYAYVEGIYFNDGIRVLDVSDPTHPTGAGTLQNGGILAYGVVASSTYAFVGGLSGMQVMNITALSNPQVVALESDMVGEATGVATRGSHVFLADTSGLRVIDNSDPAPPKEPPAQSLCPGTMPTWVA
jgi:hypothetical protein